MKTGFFFTVALVLLASVDCRAGAGAAGDAAVQAGQLNAQIGAAVNHSTHCDTSVSARLPGSSTTAFTKVATDKFCEDPYNTICGASAAGLAFNRRMQIQPLKEKAKKAALYDVAKLLKVKDPEDFTEADIAKYKPALFRAGVEETYREQLASHAFADGGGISQAAINKAETTIRDSLTQAIATVPGLNVFERARLLSRVAKTRIYTDLSAKVMKAIGRDDISDKLYEACGPDALNDNAFATKDRDGEPIVIVCPGTLFAAQGAGSDQKSNLFALLQTLGHELGHQIDSSQAIADDVYGPFEACIERYHTTHLKSPDKYEFGETGFKARVRTHAKEIEADFWGTQTAVQYIKSQKPALDRNQKLRVLRESWEDLCGGKDDSDHPDDHFRIEVLLRRDPAIHELMECSEPPESRLGYTGLNEFSKPGCTLAGPTKKDLF